MLEICDTLWVLRGVLTSDFFHTLIAIKSNWEFFINRVCCYDKIYHVEILFINIGYLSQSGYDKTWLVTYLLLVVLQYILGPFFKLSLWNLDEIEHLRKFPLNK